MTARRKEPRCHCGYTARKHCSFDEPGGDHAMYCEKMHHEFKPQAATR